MGLFFLGKTDPDEPSSAPRADCPLCTSDGGRLLWKGAYWRAITPDDPALPGFVRLVLNRHCTELTQIATIEQTQLFKLLIAIEKSMRSVLRPDKINIASLGNQVAHLHWHIIPRWHDDPFFPDSIWSPQRRDEASAERDDRQQRAQLLFAELPTLCSKTIY
jgi:diadenosine tetraphosphate (Ap4A) HIT family hydrolase